MGAYYDKARKGWRYRFWLFGERQQSPRTFETKRDALDAEAVLRKRLKNQAAGLEPELVVAIAPTFMAWAGIYQDHIQRLARDGHLKRPDIIEGNLRVLLRFFGARTEQTAPAKGEEAPFHDLRLDDPLKDPSWLTKFDDWCARRDVAKWTKYHYLTTASELYALTQHDDYRHLAGAIERNPFAHRPRPRGKRRKVTVTPPQLVAWLGAASYHVRLAMAIAALVPKLRVANILALEWRKHIDLKQRIVIVDEHKTDDDDRPLSAPISDQLAVILQDARHRHPRSRFVVLYHGGPVQTIEGGVRGAAEAAGITYGRDVPGGVTFHTLRHSMATLLARLGIDPKLRQLLMGHRDAASTHWYTHLDNVEDQREASEQLAAQLPIVHVVTAARTRAPRRPKKGHVPAAATRQPGSPSTRRAIQGLRRGPQIASRKRA